MAIGSSGEGSIEAGKMGNPMYRYHYHGSDPRSLATATTETLRDDYLVRGLFVDGECTLAYSLADRLVVGGVKVGAEPIAMPRHAEPPSLASQTFLAQREMAVVNVSGVAAVVTIDNEAIVVGPRDCLYLPKGTGDVVFSGAGAELYLVSCLAHRACERKLLSASDAIRLERGTAEASNRRTIYQYVIPGICESAQLVLGLTQLHPGSVWNTMPPHVHLRRSEIYFYFDLPSADDRIMHFMGEGSATRHIVVANAQAVISPPWSIHMGAGTGSYAFIWAMAGENQDYEDMQVLDICQLA